MSALKRMLAPALLLPIWAGCATVPPVELTEAQMAYRQVSTGPAATAAPDELHKAKASLDQAEQAFAADPNGARTRDLAYIAQRKALIADAKGRIELDQRQRADASARSAQAQAKLQQRTQHALQATRQQLEANERAHALDSERREARAQLDRERAASQEKDQKLQAAEEARAIAEQKTEAAMRDLAKIAALREEERGLVLTLSGDLLFSSGQAVLLPSAQLKLNQVVDALKDTPQRLVIEGHTDSRGSASMNDQLSLQRAQAVRDFLVSRGIAAERCEVAGYGKSRPVADNRTAEGRADNRRVEIIIEGKRTATR